MCLFANAQIQDLAKLANGKIIFHSTLYDDEENIFGYLYLYEQDVNEQSKTIEYVFLDKNLNKVSNGTFPSKTYKSVNSEYYNCTLMGDCIILNKYYYYTPTFGSVVKPLLATFQTISLTDNKVSAEFKYENAEIKEFVADYETMKSNYKSLDVRCFVNAFSNENFKGFLITEDNHKNAYLEKQVKLLNEKREFVWSFNYNPIGTKDRYSTFRILYSHKNTIYVSTPTWERDEFNGAMVITSYNIIALDLQTGAKKFEYLLENSKGPYSHTLRMSQLDDKLVLTGNYSPYKSTDFSLDQNLGFYKIVLDEKGQEIESKYTQWSEFSSQMEIDKKGRVKQNYRLKPIKYFFFKNGAISILTEKFKYDTWSSGYPKSTDFVLFNMNPDFTPSTINTIAKEKSYFSTDYLFSQYIKDKTGVVFFYREEVTDPNAGVLNQNSTLMLGINTIIDGRLSEEKIQLTAKKKYYIYPYQAKEGYIMLREYNEKDKYNQIRLEKLNF